MYYQYLPLLAFIISITLTIKQPKFKIFKKEILFDYGLASVIGILILFATFSLSLTDVWDAIKGNEFIKPYEIIILFMALAYICISIDATGFFKYISLKVAKAAGSDGYRLFIYFFFLSSILTTFTSNDIVILTLTPIICYFALYTGVDAIPFLIAQFFAANIWSMALYIGNPTNIIVAEAHKLTFSEYSYWMILPTIVAGLSCLLLLFLIFRKRLNRKIEFPEVDIDATLTDKPGAIFGLTCLSVCLVLLLIAPATNLSISAITLGCALVLFTRNLSVDIFSKKKSVWETKEILAKMPWKIIPFVAGMFIIIHQIFSAGWGDIFSGWLSQISTGIFSSVMSVGFLSSIACNFMNNQPMTIFFTHLIQSSSYVAEPLIKKGVMFAVIIGSNLGANITLVGALAGIMWKQILKDKGIDISFWKFLKYGLLVMPIVIFLCCLVLVFELYIFG